METYLERIAAVMARRNPEFVIIARTDARNATTFGGESAGEEAFKEGVKRLKAALAAGADVAFMKSPRTRDECKRLAKALHPHPVMINVLPNGRVTTPRRTAWTWDSSLQSILARASSMRRSR